MSEPLVSVKMITYNHAPYIAQAIEGVLQQKTDYPFELVIGEDCSTDGTREIVFEYEKKYPDIIRVITSEKNVGMKKNGYRTTKACRGKYIAFCEGDDYWHRTDKLQKQVDYLESHPDCGMVSADCDIFYNSSNIYKRRFNYNNGYQSPANLSIEEVLWGELPIWTCTVMIRKDLCLQLIESDAYLHKNENLGLGDLQLWAEMAVKGKVTYIPETMATYRVLDESASRSKDDRKTLRFMKSISDIKLYLCDKYSLSDELRRMEESTWYDRAMRLSFHERNAELAVEVRRKKKKLNWKEWTRYYGARNTACHYIYQVAAFIPSVFRKKSKQWP